MVIPSRPAAVQAKCLVLLSGRLTPFGGVSAGGPTSNAAAHCPGVVFPAGRIRCPAPSLIPPGTPTRPSLDRPDPVIMNHVLAEHSDLFQLVSRAKTAFADTGRPLAKRREFAVATIESLRAHLHEHFTQEEQGGFLEEAVTRIPRLGHRMEEILKQHPALLAELDRLTAALADSRLIEADWLKIGRQFAAFVDHLQAHERSENAVVQEGYNEDLGLGDD